ncbi:helix-turn-helix domain-containing protein [Micromonospora sp. CB01531]|uniref:helix-turn-helix domain-containing protein n=1 Tax=Micromonospora sp. CB01531 TaxID=1718947 RepID=UPI001F51D622|nr:helix-turn-helix domain-containing protein [Micromonospora sp. CB01531]
MDDPSVVAERGVLTAPAEVWQLAVRRAEVIGRLADGDAVGHVAADTAAAELGISRRQVYELLRRWRAGAGVVSDLVPGKSSGGRGREQLSEPVEAVIREVLRTRYLSRQLRSMAAVHREVARVCLSRGLPVPSKGALVRRAAKLDPAAAVGARQGPDAARDRRSAGGVTLIAAVQRTADIRAGDRGISQPPWSARGRRGRRSRPVRSPRPECHARGSGSARRSGVVSRS